MPIQQKGSEDIKADTDQSRLNSLAFTPIENRVDPKSYELRAY